MLVAVTLEQCWHDVPGGTAGAALGLTAALAGRDGMEVVGVSARHESEPDEPWVPQVPVVQLGVPRQAMYAGWHTTGRPSIEAAMAASPFGLPDVVHATGVSVPGTDVPLVVTVHDLAFEHFPEHPTRWGLRFFRKATDRARRLGEAIICPSEATANDCIAHGFDSGRLHVVPWGIDWPVASHAEVAQVRDALDLPERYIVWVGTIEPRKNLETLLGAFALLDDDLDLVLVGPTGWGPVPQPPAGVAERVRFTGFVPDDLLPSVYRGALATCYPSLLEGFGLPVLESMSQGTPVVTSCATATEEVLGGGGLAVNPTSSAAVAEALRSIVDSPTEREHLSQRALEQVAAFTWERSAELTADVYESVLR